MTEQNSTYLVLDCAYPRIGLQAKAEILLQITYETWLLTTV